MNYLKLFEDFEEKPFYIINFDDYIDMNHHSINLDDYPLSKDIIKSIKSRLPKAFGHDQFSCFTIKGKNEVFIYERLHSLVEYKFFITEDDWIYLRSLNYGREIRQSLYKCDSIKGLIEAIKYDFTYQKTASLFYFLPDTFKSYGKNILKNAFITCNKVLLRTPIQFSMGEFPVKEVESMLSSLPVKARLSNVVNWIYELHFYGQDNKICISMPLYYIKESNQFICHKDKTREHYACCGVDGLKRLINYLF
jgi:hypothetical protein